MRQILAIFLIAVAYDATSQASTTYGNFKVVDQQLIYQKVFLQDSISMDKLVKYYGTIKEAQDLQHANDKIDFRLKDLVVDYAKFQFSQVSTPPVIQTGKFHGDVSVDIKDGRYRVSITNIMFSGNLGYKKVNEAEPLTNYACRNSGTYISQDWTKPNTLGLLDKAITDKLQFIEAEEKKGDGEW